MINKHKKGANRELELRKKLTDEGWLCETKNWNRYASKDFYGLFDILAIKDTDIRFIQVKSNKSDVYKARRNISNWLRDNNLNIRCEIWWRENYKEWENEVVE